MFNKKSVFRQLLWVGLLSVGPSWAHAAALLNSVQLISSTTTPGPKPQTFTVSATASYTFTLIDLQQPAALASLGVAIANSTAVVATLSVNEPAPAPASKTVTLQPGTYTAQVVATAATGQPGGAFELQATVAGESVANFPYDDVVAAPEPAPSSGQSGLSSKFTVTAAGTYQLNITDLQFPAALQSLQMIVLNDCSSTPGCVTAPVARAALSGTSLTASLNLSQGTYDLFIEAQSNAPALEGLYSVQIVNGSTTAYAATVPVGQLTVAASLTVATSSVSLQLTDLSTPAALASLAAVVTQGPNVLKSYTGAGIQTFSVAGSTVFGPVQVYVAAQPGSGGQGAYELYAQSGSTMLADVAQPVLAAGAVGYEFPVSNLTVAGNYQLGIYDFALPQPFSSLNAVVAQAGQVLATTSSGSGIFAVAAAPLTVLVFPTLASASAEGLFGVELVEPNANSIGTASPVALEATQGVGAQFNALSVQIMTAGLYDLTLTDLNFPSKLGNASVILTQGYSNPGSAYPIGSTAVNLTPGTYTLNVLAQTSAGASYGLYGLDVSPAPTVTLSASPTSVNSTGAVTLTWSSANTDACTASASPQAAGWSGSLTTSGSQSSGALAATTTFSIVCSNANGNTANATASVSVTSPPATSHSGGGGMNTTTVMVLSLFALWQIRRRQSAGR